MKLLRLGMELYQYGTTHRLAKRLGLELLFPLISRF
jgi:hypothetical protein